MQSNHTGKGIQAPPKAMFITDFDGTLYRSDHTFSERDIMMLEKLKEHGVLRVIATGRSLFSLERAVKIELPVDYVIFSTGGGIASYPAPLDHILVSHTLLENETEKIAHVFEQLGLDYMIHKPVPENHMFSYKRNGRENSDFDRRLALYKGVHQPILKDSDKRVLAAQLLAVVPREEMPPLEELRKELAEFNVIPATSPIDGETFWIEVFPRGVSKSRAASWLAERYNLGPDQAIAVGNDYNDEDLLAWAGSRYVVANAPDELKTRFPVVASNNHCGVAEVIETCLRRPCRGPNF